MTTVTLNPRFVFGAGLIGLTLVAILWAGVRNIQTSQGPRERRYILWMTPILWLLLLTFIAGVYSLQAPWSYAVGLVHFAVIPVFMYRCTMRRQLIREIEARQPSARGIKLEE